MVYADTDEVAGEVTVSLHLNGALQTLKADNFSDFEFGLLDNTEYGVTINASGYKPQK